MTESQAWMIILISYLLLINQIFSLYINFKMLGRNVLMLTNENKRLLLENERLAVVVDSVEFLETSYKTFVGINSLEDRRKYLLSLL